MTEGQFWPPAQPRVVEGPVGPMGPQGPPGTAYLSSQWTFNQTATPPPVSGGLRFNATTAAATTIVYISETDRDGLNRAAGLDQLVAGDQMMIQSQQGRTVFNVVAHADSGTYRSITVTVAETSGTRPSASAITTVYLMTAGAAGTVILSGTATPGDATGSVGNYYLDADDYILYGPKATPSLGAAQYVTPAPGSSNQSNTVLGMKFQFDVAGYVTGIRVRVDGVTDPIWEAYLYTAAGVLLASKDFAAVTGWNNVIFDTPVPVTRATIYVAAFWQPVNGSSGAQFVAYAGQTSGNVTGIASSATFGSTRDTFPASGTSGTWAVSPIFAAGAPIWPVALRSVPPGGTTGQILKKTSNADYAVGWVT